MNKIAIAGTTAAISRISHDPVQMQHVYETGRTAGERNLSAMLEFLSRSEN